MQGLNSIVGTFLLNLKEEESFWIILYFMEKLGYKDLFKDDFNKINLLNYQLELYLDHYMPEISEYFVKKFIILIMVY